MGDTRNDQSAWRVNKLKDAYTCREILVYMPLKVKRLAIHCRVVIRHPSLSRNRSFPPSIPTFQYSLIPVFCYYTIPLFREVSDLIYEQKKDTNSACLVVVVTSRERIFMLENEIKLIRDLVEAGGPQPEQYPFVHILELISADRHYCRTSLARNITLAVGFGFDVLFANQIRPA